ncbi:MAG TPA: hypothetical protein DCY40_05575 [Actinobacteria bacterium]|nr:hypothetical protein [Actinomycetota bacterium]
MNRPDTASAASAFVVFTGLWTVLAIAHKVIAARAAAYTSDLYDYHQSLQSTTDGSFFRSYVFGNVMGDHGYLLLFLLVPIYLLAPSIGYWVLVVITPLVMALSASFIRLILVERGYRYPGTIAATLLGLPGVWWLIHEPIYGFHPDTLALPLFSLAVVGLAGRSGRAYDLGDRIGFLAFLAFVSLKEEMALLGIVLGLPLLLKSESRRLGVILTGAAAAASVFAFALIAWSSTPFNRGNSSLIGDAIGDLVPWPGFAIAAPQLIPLALGMLLIAITGIHLPSLDPVKAGAAFAVALKIASLAVVVEHLPSWSWHLALPLAGAWLLVVRLFETAPMARAGPVVLVAVVVAIGTVAIDARWAIRYGELLDSRRIGAVESAQAYRAFAPQVGSGVISVPPFDLHAWRGHASTTFPRGLSLSPRGISDYVVTGSAGLPSEYEGFTECMEVVASTRWRILYARVGECPFAEDRELFDRLVGLP